ncbi:hypothetical protein M3B11_08480 [Brevibacterium sp. p3-SID960]|uniref:hypothetical protein n=1 Tax=Brevibacterium sp. p3-SID960 TaxID=2916063 RepID=UPI0021A816FB|nr:hypothetical protein [Brevibacterium sp. p3-SID960]MCT1690985.1 hypothetical protein [Brevibacterium sp. p3-SID960]
MEILRDILLFLHLLGMAIIIGGYFATIRRPRVMPGMLHAAYLQLITGIGLVGIIEMAGDPSAAFHMKVGIKALLAIAVTVTAFIGNRKQKRAHATAGAGEPAAATGPEPSAGLAHATFALALLAVLVAVFVNV